MNREDREALRRAVDIAARERAAGGYLDCDPESLTSRANEAEELGHVEIAATLRNFRLVVNELFGEGWPLARIEAAVHDALEHFEAMP